MPDTAKSIRENAARAKVYLRRHELPVALTTLAAALQEYACAKAFGPTRFEIEAAFNDALSECNRIPEMQQVLIPPGGDKPVQLKFVRGKEAPLAGLLATLATRFAKDAALQSQEEERQRQNRRVELMEKTKSLLRQGDRPKGRAFANKLLDEYGKDDPGLYLSIADTMRAADLGLDAAELLENAITLFPKESTLYSALIDIYASAGMYEKAEEGYRRVLKQFGKHPKTLLNLARAYATWGRKAKAVALLYQITYDYPTFQEAKDALTQLEGR